MIPEPEVHAGTALPDRLLPWPKVRDLTGISRTTAWRLQKTGDFPPPVVISPGRVGWRESELTAWKDSRAPRRAAPTPRAMKRSHPQPAPSAAEEPGLPIGDRANPPEAPPSSARRAVRRRTATTSQQIAFDFG